MIEIDILLALWAHSLCIVAAVAYFKGARDQLNACVERRMEQWSTDEIWAVSLCAVAAFAYFKGAKHQLNACVERRMEQWSTDEIWAQRCDISKARWR